MFVQGIFDVVGFVFGYISSISSSSIDAPPADVYSKKHLRAFTVHLPHPTAAFCTAGVCVMLLMAGVHGGFSKRPSVGLFWTW